jgi:hypothetical protein
MYINTYIQDTWNKDDIPDTSKIDGDLTSLGFENSVWVNVILSSLWNVENIGGVGIWMFIYVCINLYLCSIYMYVYTYIYIYIHVSTYAHLYIHIHIKLCVGQCDFILIMECGELGGVGIYICSYMYV